MISREGFPSPSSSPAESHKELSPEEARKVMNRVMRRMGHISFDSQFANVGPRVPGGEDMNGNKLTPQEYVRLFKGAWGEGVPDDELRQDMLVCADYWYGQGGTHPDPELLDGIRAELGAPSQQRGAASPAEHSPQQPPLPEASKDPLAGTKFAAKGNDELYEIAGHRSIYDLNGTERFPKIDEKGEEGEEGEDNPAYRQAFRDNPPLGVNLA